MLPQRGGVCARVLVAVREVSWRRCHGEGAHSSCEGMFKTYSPSKTHEGCSLLAANLGLWKASGIPHIAALKGFANKIR